MAKRPHRIFKFCYVERVPLITNTEVLERFLPVAKEGSCLKVETNTGKVIRYVLINDVWYELGDTPLGGAKRKVAKK